MSATKRNPAINDRHGGAFLSAGVGVRLEGGNCMNNTVDVELALTHLGALDATFDGETLRFKVLGNCERNDLAEALEWVARRIRIRGEGAA